MPITTSTATPRRRSAWLDAKATWAGVAIASMWLAVLFVGLFGGDIVSTHGVNGSTGLVGNGTRTPVVVVVAVCALIATIFVARWGFREPPPKDDA